MKYLNIFHMWYMTYILCKYIYIKTICTYIFIKIYLYIYIYLLFHMYIKKTYIYTYVCKIFIIDI